MNFLHILIYDNLLNFSMKTVVIVACFTLAALAAFTTLLLNSDQVSAQMAMNTNMMSNSTMSKDGSMMMNPHMMGHMMMKPGSYAFGTIASLQNDAEGNPAWILSGFYKGSLSSDNKTQDGTAKGNLPNATLNAKFSMVMTNGSAMHQHKMYDFKLTNMSMPDKSTTVFNGTVTITMKQGPVSGVPIGIKAMDNNAISVWLDPTKIENHFGNTPIYGTIEKLIEVHK